MTVAILAPLMLGWMQPAKAAVIANGDGTYNANGFLVNPLNHTVGASGSSFFYGFVRDYLSAATLTLVELQPYLGYWSGRNSNGSLGESWGGILSIDAANKVLSLSSTGTGSYEAVGSYQVQHTGSYPCGWFGSCGYQYYTTEYYNYIASYPVDFSGSTPFTAAVQQVPGPEAGGWPRCSCHGWPLRLDEAAPEGRTCGSIGVFIDREATIPGPPGITAARFKASWTQPASCIWAA